MKATIIAAALTLGAMFATSANAAVLWSCKTRATLTNKGTDIILAERIKYVGVAKITCYSVTSGVVRFNAKMKISGVGIGPAIRGPVNSVPLKLAFNVGVAAPDALYGQYNLDLGASLNLIAVKLTPSVGVEAGSREFPSAEIAVSAADQIGLGARVNLTKMTISPLN